MSQSSTSPISSAGNPFLFLQAREARRKVFAKRDDPMTLTAATVRRWATDAEACLVRCSLLLSSFFLHLRLL